MSSPRGLRCVLGVVVLMLSCLMGSGALAQTLSYAFDEGNLSFNYQQWPFGSLAGNFNADGYGYDPEHGFPAGQTHGCSGGMDGAVGDTITALAVGVIENANGTMDGAAVLVRFPNAPATGTYNVDLDNMTVGFVWLDDVEAFTIPEPEFLAAWLDTVSAVHKFFSTSGSVTVTQADEDGFGGTFSGQAADPDAFKLINVSSGQFAVNYAVTSVPQTLTHGAKLTAYPNPFNPETRIALSLPQAGITDVAVYDLTGRRVRHLYSGTLAAGPHSWAWNGLDDAGVRQSGGLYICRAQGDGWRVGQKLVLVP